MDQERQTPEEQAPPPRLSLAEEQRQAFEADRERARERRPILSVRWPDLILRN